MPKNTLERYRDVTVVNADHIILKIALDLKEKDENFQRKAFAGTALSGYFYLHAIHEFPTIVLECVMSPDGTDAVSAVYVKNRIFNSGGSLIEARTALIEAIAQAVGLSAEGIGIEDAGRGRMLGLNELTTGQLIDTLAGHSSKSIIQTGGHTINKL